MVKKFNFKKKKPSLKKKAKKPTFKKKTIKKATKKKTPVKKKSTPKKATKKKTPVKKKVAKKKVIKKKDPPAKKKVAVKKKQPVKKNPPKKEEPKKKATKKKAPLKKKATGNKNEGRPAPKKDEGSQSNVEELHKKKASKKKESQSKEILEKFVKKYEKKGGRDKKSRGRKTAKRSSIATKSQNDSHVFSSSELRRPNYFEGQVVKNEHLITEQDYLDFLRGVNQYYINQVSGVLTGFDITPSGKNLIVDKGLGHYPVTLNGFNVMREICLLDEETIELKKFSGLTEGGRYQLVAFVDETDESNWFDRDKNFDEYNYKVFKVKFDVISESSALSNGISLCLFDYVNGKAENLEQRSKVPITVRTFNGIKADEAGDVIVPGEKFVEFINEADTQIDVDRVDKLGQALLDIETLREEVVEVARAILEISSEVNLMDRRIPRIVSF